MSDRIEPWFLVADIGGTNARFAAVPRATGVAGPPVILPTAAYPTFEAAASEAIEKLGGADGLAGMVLAMAGPVDGETVKLTNAAWTISRRDVARRFRLFGVEIINDFMALVLALNDLPADGTVVLQAGTPVPRGNRVILGPGTGLGAAALIAAPDGGWTPLAGEGGHATYAPETDEEWRVAQALRGKYGRVSIERVVSGPGLVDVAAALGAPPSVATAAEVVASPDPACRSAVEIFLRGVGRVAGDLALTLDAAGGVFLAGGILPRLRETPGFAPLTAAFTAKGRNTARLQRVRLSLIVCDNPALIGLAARARSLMAEC